jgi:uncharacterized protein (TIGR02594 family)
MFFISFSSQKSFNSLINSSNLHRVGMRSTSDYSGFGVQLDGRTSESEGYRYGFQGQERDDEVKGDGNSVNYAFRMFDSRVGRFLSLDPIAAAYPHNSVYAFSENRVIDCIELEGLECYWAADGKAFLGQVGESNEIRICNSSEVEIHVKNALFKQKIGADKDIQINLETGKSSADNYRYDCEQAILNSKSAETYYSVLLGTTFARPIEKLNSETSSGEAISTKKDATPWLTTAKSEIGVQELTNSNDGPRVEEYLKIIGAKKGTSWCGAFVKWCLSKNKISTKKGTGVASSWSNYGQKLDKPAYGAIAYMSCDDYPSHVGFVVGITPDEVSLLILGGNQSHSVRISSIPKECIQSYTYPEGYEPSYELPKGTAKEMNNVR